MEKLRRRSFFGTLAGIGAVTALAIEAKPLAVGSLPSVPLQINLGFTEHESRRDFSIEYCKAQLIKDWLCHERSTGQIFTPARLLTPFGVSCHFIQAGRFDIRVIDQFDCGRGLMITRLDMANIEAINDNVGSSLYMLHIPR